MVKCTQVELVQESDPEDNEQTNSEIPETDELADSEIPETNELANLEIPDEHELAAVQFLAELSLEIEAEDSTDRIEMEQFDKHIELIGIVREIDVASHLEQFKDESDSSNPFMNSCNKIGTPEFETFREQLEVDMVAIFGEKVIDPEPGEPGADAHRKMPKKDAHLFK